MKLKKKKTEKGYQRHVECNVCGKNSRAFILATRDRVLSQSGWKLTARGWVCGDPSCKKASKSAR